ncbi:hypothetical protein GCM10010503_36800 [Streptomyces lucensis JCM 4490]|uniref:Uncharacterized protein n=1 Tax=Streptomyces lucensis JCM 4490 TaxID=1306176 RepID=A0A918MS13_9ACTN|nr:hypothetical protein [Streptomyces lucensis]GGW56313.1 hypothetical protein GCM10010503_36800 [Streptomyces lucensis JCM 4490]
MLVGKVRDLLTGTHLARLTPTTPQADGKTMPLWWFAPTTGRWAEESTAQPKTARTGPRRGTPAPKRPPALQQGLFSTSETDMNPEEHPA